MVLIGIFVSFFSTRDRLPASTYVGDIDVSALSINEAITRTSRLLLSPVALRYQTSIIQMHPADIDYQVNDVVLQLQLDKIIKGQQGLDKLPQFVLHNSPDTHINVPYQYSVDKLNQFLSTLANQYDRKPTPPQPNAKDLSLTAGRNGVLLNTSESEKLLLNALQSGSSRFVDLPVDTIPIGSRTISSLGDLIKQRLAQFPGGTAGVFVKDLKTGQEFSLNSDVAFSAQGWLKIAIAVDAIRVLSPTADSPTVQQLGAMVTSGANASANDFLGAIGQGDAQAGASQLNDMLKRMGLVSTFLAQPYDQTSTPLQVITPGNSRTDVSTSPDALAQSTPAEISVMLEMLEQCRNNGGALMLAFKGEFTPAKCELALNTLGQNNANILVAASSPGATVIQRQSWDANNHGDAALVRSPGGAYILTVMLHSNSTLNWSDTSQVINDIARAAYGYFNNGQIPAQAPALNAPPPQ
ncbi:MAG: class A beta-lactamase-related serine hydrolase [Chloroflexi bacterium]|nr:class A beta-lactamase-related serine hydrolase [Chloroflexota bacterium]